MSTPRVWGRVAAAVLLAAGVYSCPKTKPAKPKVTEIELVPSQVAVTSDATVPTTFVLEARLWSGPANDRASIIESAGIPLTWSVKPSGLGLHLKTAPNGYLATLVLDAGAAPTTPIEVKVKAGGLDATTQVIPSSISGEKWIAAAYADELVPDAVVVRGIRTTADQPCAIWLQPGLVRKGLAGPVTGLCAGVPLPWGVALLGPAHGMQMWPVPWSSGVAGTSPAATAPIRVMPVAVRVFLTGNNLSTRQTTAQGFANDEIDYANTVFSDNRVGIRLDPVDVQTVPPPTTPGVETNVTDCTAGDRITGGQDHLPVSEAMLHIYLVDGTGTVDAFTCAASKDRPQPVIYLAAGHSGTILVHEISHALGLVLPGAGHTDEIKGFDAADVMAGGYADTDDVWRSRLTVGQVFRMNADSGSWLNSAKDLVGNRLRESTAPQLGCQCGYDDPPSTPPGWCPRLSDDIARIRGGLGSLQTWDCGDQVWLDPVDLSEHPRALIAGRQWRSALTECRRDFAGRPLTHDGRIYLQTANLTRPPAECSWVAIFFESHSPVFLRDAAMDGVWNDAADIRYARNTLNPPTMVTVHVWYDPKDDGVIGSLLDETRKIYGPDNRTGLTFNFVQHNTLPTSCPPDLPFPSTVPPKVPPAEYQICYSSTSGPSIPQLVGKKWGLHVLAGAELSNPAFTNNAMGLSTVHDKLTLGQVFRIHSVLQTKDFPPDCNIPASPCPTLDVDVKP